MNKREIIPTDLIFAILSNLPAKSIARFRCVSKLWDSTLGRSYFTELFLTRSSARPLLLFAVSIRKGLDVSEWRLYSSPQPQNPDDNSKLAAVDFCMGFDLGIYSLNNMCAVSGLIFCHRFTRDERIAPLICNPTTGQSVSLPTSTQMSLYNFFGYDPIGKQYKILCMSYVPRGKEVVDGYQYHLLTFGCEKKSSWRSIQCPTRHEPLSSDVCINGILYYVARKEDASPVLVIVCFDLRFEKFVFLNEPEVQPLWTERPACLTNFQGKLVSIRLRDLGLRARLELCLWVLEDGKKYEWSKHVYPLSLPFDNCFSETLHFDDYVGNTYVVGMIGTGEIVLSTKFVTSNLFYIVYFNPKRNTLRKVEIQGMTGCKGRRLETFLGHVENLNFIT